jgi:hypothetical protein
VADIDLYRLGSTAIPLSEPVFVLRQSVLVLSKSVLVLSETVLVLVIETTCSTVMFVQYTTYLRMQLN